MTIEEKRLRVRHAKQHLLSTIQDIPEPLRTMNEREMALRLAIDRDTQGSLEMGTAERERKNQTVGGPKNERKGSQD